MGSTTLLLLCFAAATTLTVATTPLCTNEDVNIVERHTGQKWPHGIIPYSISEHISELTRSKLLSAMHRWENISCVVFIPHTTELNYVSFEIGEQCCSNSGYIGQGKQYVLLSTQCTGPSPDSEHILNEMIKLLVGSFDESANDVAENAQLTVETDETQERGNCEETCGGYALLDPAFNQIEHFLSTPFYPTHYQAYLDCVWKLVAPDGYAVHIIFHDVDIEDDRTCRHDFVRVQHLDRQENVLRSRTHCGAPELETINMESDHDYNTSVSVVHFHSDSFYSGKGFRLGYQLKEKRVNFTDPCLEDNGGCAQVCTSDKYGGHVCSCREGYRQTRRGSCLDINECKMKGKHCKQKCLNTDGSFLCDCKPGYGLSPDQVSCHSCRSQYNRSSGTLHPPGYPISYLHNQNCHWTIHRWPNHHLNITIEYIDIVPSKKCTEDFLKLEHGHFPHQRRLCDFSHDRITYMINESMDVRFRSRRTNNHHSGFVLHYKQVLSSELGFLDLNYVKINDRYVLYGKRLWI